MSAYAQVTLAKFTTAVRNRLGPSAFWTDDELRQYINAALRTWNALTGYWHGRITFSTKPNNIYYCLPNNLVFGAHLEFNGTPLAKGSMFEWDQSDPNWEATRGLSQEWSPVGLRIIALRPADGTGGNSVLIDGITVTPALVNPGDYIDIGQEEFKALVDYVQHIAAFKEGGQEFASTIALHKQFLMSAAIRNEKLRASALYRKTMGLDTSLQQKPWRRKSQDDPVGVR